MNRFQSETASAEMRLLVVFIYSTFVLGFTEETLVSGCCSDSPGLLSAYYFLSDGSSG